MIFPHAGTAGNTGKRHGSRTPYRGYPAAKPTQTVAFWRHGPVHAPRWRTITASGGRRANLLSVTDQHLVAGCGQLWTVLLKARQNDEIAPIHQRAAESRNVARAGFLLLLRAAVLALCEGGAGGGYGQQREYH